MDLQEVLLNKVSLYISSNTNQIMKDFLNSDNNMAHRPLFTFLDPCRKFYAYHSNAVTILFDYEQYWEPYISNYDSDEIENYYYDNYYYETYYANKCYDNNSSDYDSNGNVYNSFQCMKKYLNVIDKMNPIYKRLRQTAIDVKNSGANQIKDDYSNLRLL